MERACPELVLSDTIADQAGEQFRRLERRLRNLLGPDAEIHHVGATAISGLLTKGDLDVLVRVVPKAFPHSSDILDGAFRQNTGSVRTADFAAYVDESSSWDIGLQLVAIGGEFDFFLAFRDKLLASPTLRSRYNRIKSLARGQGSEHYRMAKSEFIKRVLGS